MGCCFRRPVQEDAIPLVSKARVSEAKLKFEGSTTSPATKTAAAAPCTLCRKATAPSLRATDSRDRVCWSMPLATRSVSSSSIASSFFSFSSKDHRECLRCAECSRGLAGAVATMVGTRLLCERHAAAPTKVDVVSAPAGQSRRASMLAATVDVDVTGICEEIGDKIVCQPPTCLGCGGVFERSDEKTMKINGMLKFHGDCGFGAPGKGRKALVVAKEPRVVARSCPEVFALRLRTCPAAGGSTAVMTFYMKVDESSLRAATGIKPNPKLRRGQWETVTVRYVPYESAKVSARKPCDTHALGTAQLELEEVTHSFLPTPDDSRLERDGSSLVFFLMRLEFQVQETLSVEFNATNGTLALCGASILLEEVPVE